MGYHLEKRVRARMSELGLSVSELAKRVKVSRVALYHFFKGNFSRDMLERVSKVLSIPVHTLLAPLDEESSRQEDRRVLDAYAKAGPETRHTVDVLLELDGRSEKNSRPVVVVVDDLPDNVQLLARCLRKEFDVLEFTDPELALEAVRNSHVDMVISDQRMPHMSGTELLTRVKELNRPIAKLIVSAYSDNEALLGAINDAKVDAFLMKPFHPNELRSRVQSILSSLQ